MNKIMSSESKRPEDEDSKGISNQAEYSDNKTQKDSQFKDDRNKIMRSESNRPEDEDSKGTSNQAEYSDNETQKDNQFKDDRNKIMSLGSNRSEDEDSKGTSNQAEYSDNETQKDSQFKDDRFFRSHYQSNSHETWSKCSSGKKSRTSLKCSHVRKKIMSSESKRPEDEDSKCTLNKAEYSNKETQTDGQCKDDRKLEDKIALAEEQADRYNNLIQTLREVGLQLEDNLEEDKSEKEERMTMQKSMVENYVQFENDILVAKALSSYEYLNQKIRKTEREKEGLKTEFANFKEKHRKISEKWEADEKTLQQNAKQREQYIKEKDKRIKSLNVENEKLKKTVVKKESLLKGQEQANTDLLQKQVQLQRKMQFDNEENQKAVQERDQHIQYQYGKLQQKDTEVNNLTNALQVSEKERNNLTLRLSKMAGACLTQENPNIADLSDRNRPTKLAERYSELYDNEWTDAFEELCEQKHMDEVQCIKALLNLLKVTNDECVQLTKPNREILRTLTSVSINLNSDSVHKEQSAGTEDHSLATSINPSIAIRKGENTKDNSTTELSEQSQEEDMDVDMIDDGAHLENSQATVGMNPFESHESSKGTECDPNEGKGPDEKQAGNGQPNNMQKMDEDSAHLENSPATGGMNPWESYEFVAESDCDPNEGKGPDEKQVVNGQPNDMQESDKRTESESNEGHSQDEKQSDNGQMSNVQEIEDNAKTIPEGFSLNVDTGEISAELVIDISEEDRKAVSDIRKLSSVQLETEKRISKLVAAKIAFERSIDTKRLVKVMAFITKCAELCWYMAIQEPPVVIEFHKPVDDELFEKDKYKAYTEMGEKLDYVVWPPLFLCSGGGTLCKGTAQGKK